MLRFLSTGNEKAAGLHWAANAFTHRGPNKPRNEDCVLVNEKVELAVLCDGVGGHRNGDVAANLACGYLQHMTLKDQASLTNEDSFKTLITSCHEHLLGYSADHQETAGMATTVVMALRVKGQVWVSWAGDSRAYLIRKGKLAQITKDHSLFNEKISMGLVSPKKAAEDPHRHMIVSAMGGSDKHLTRVGVAKVALRAHDRLILTSDGVHDYLPAAAIQSASTARDLVQQAIDIDTMDNCSAVCIDFN